MALLAKRPIIWRRLLIVATPYVTKCTRCGQVCDDIQPQTTHKRPTNDPQTVLCGCFYDFVSEYMYAYIHTLTRTQTHTHAHTHTHTHIHTCVCRCFGGCEHVHVWVCVCVVQFIVPPSGFVCALSTLLCCVLVQIVVLPPGYVCFV